MMFSVPLAHPAGCWITRIGGFAKHWCLTRTASSDEDYSIARLSQLTATPILFEVLSGIRDPHEYSIREADFRALPQVEIDGEAGYVAARIGKGLAEVGKTGKTVDLLLAGAAIRAGAELWSLPDDHYRDIQSLLKRGEVKVAGAFRIRWLP